MSKPYLIPFNRKSLSGSLSNSCTQASGQRPGDGLTCISSFFQHEFGLSAAVSTQGADKHDGTHSLGSSNL